MGSAIATGDFNNDGYADLAMGIPFKDGSRGQVVVLYGGTGGLSAAGNQVWNQGNLDDIREEGDQFGSALTTGDFNADGYSDLAIGVPKEDFPDVGPHNEGISRCGGICPDAGIVNLVYGTSTGLSANRNELWHQDRGNDVGGWDNWVEWQDCFGASLDAGDFDGNGADDLAIGAVCEQTGGAGEGALNNGAVNIYYGAPGVGLKITGPAYLRQWYPSIVGWPQKDDAYGYALAAELVTSIMMVLATWPLAYRERKPIVEVLWTQERSRSSMESRLRAWTLMMQIEMNSGAVTVPGYSVMEPGDGVRLSQPGISMPMVLMIYR